MSQFDVFRSPRAGIYPLVVDVQADLHAKLATRIVVPLVLRTRYAAQPLARLTPILKVRGDEYVLVFPLLAAVPKASLGELVGSLAAQRATLIAALDLLITGS
jgi:toxin CcdB